MYAAYCKIFTRCGLDYLPVEAESGPIGGDASHEFMVPAENGEDMVVHCRECGYAANLERAEVGPVGDTPARAPQQPLQKVDTPNASTIEQVSRFLKCRPQDMIKTLIYTADGRPIAVLVRGDHEANEAKIRRALDAGKIALAEPAVIEQFADLPSEVGPDPLEIGERSGRIGPDGRHRFHEAADRAGGGAIRPHTKHVFTLKLEQVRNVLEDGGDVGIRHTHHRTGCTRPCPLVGRASACLCYLHGKSRHPVELALADLRRLVLTRPSGPSRNLTAPASDSPYPLAGR